MKTKRILTGIASLVVAFAMNAQEIKPINLEKSTIEWVGKKVTGQHNGTIAFKTGEVSLDKYGAVTGGFFIVDMNTISVLDLDGAYKAKLEGHLKSDDFFGVEKFPEATFTIKSVAGNQVTGNLTIKGHTVAQVVTLSLTDHTISGKIAVDRTKFDIRYGSTSFFDNLKDKAIDNEFELTVNIAF